MNKIDFAFLRHVYRSCFDEFNLLSDISQKVARGLSREPL